MMPPRRNRIVEVGSNASLTSDEIKDGDRWVSNDRELTGNVDELRSHDLMN